MSIYPVFTSTKSCLTALKACPYLRLGNSTMFGLIFFCWLVVCLRIDLQKEIKGKKRANIIEAIFGTVSI